jgi:membrane peptidoglycan carboxypeptidase
MLTDMLKTAAAQGSAKALAACGLPVAGKTGTVAEGSDGTRDIWTVAYTPDTALCVWMGFDDPGSGNRMAASEGGSGYPARLCAAFLGDVSAQLSGRDFRRPAGVKTALIDSVALTEDRAALLSTERTPVEYTRFELFHGDDMPSQFSAHWLSPAAPPDFRLLTEPGQVPILAFTSQDSDAEYVLTRTVDDESAEVAVLKAGAGQEIRFADEGCDLEQCARYALLPRNGLLYARGELLTGPVSQSVAYAPGGLLNTIMGVGEVEAPPTPAEADETSRQSLFG